MKHAALMRVSQQKVTEMERETATEWFYVLFFSFSFCSMCVLGLVQNVRVLVVGKTKVSTCFSTNLLVSAFIFLLFSHLVSLHNMHFYANTQADAMDYSIMVIAGFVMVY